GGMVRGVPGGLRPDEERGVIVVLVRLPDGASLERNEKVTAEAEAAVLSIPGVQDTTTLGGLDITTRTNSSNVSTIIAVLKPWEERKSEALQFGNILTQANVRASRVQGAFVFAFGLPP